MVFGDLVKFVETIFPIFKTILDKHIKPQKTGRPRSDEKQILLTILYVLKTGTQWRMLPDNSDLAKGSTAHSVFQKWVKLGIMDEFFAVSRKIYKDKIGFKLTWTSVDCTLIKTRVIALPIGKEDTGKNPTDRGRSGTKISCAVDQTGASIGFTIGPANIHDSKYLKETLVQGSLLSLLEPDLINTKKHLCLDKGYDGNSSEECAYLHGYKSHIRTRGEEKIEKKKGKRAKRFVVEAHFAWLKAYRHIQTRFTKYSINFNGLICLADCVILLKRVFRAIVTHLCPDEIPAVDMDACREWLQQQRAY